MSAQEPRSIDPQQLRHLRWSHQKRFKFFVTGIVFPPVCFGVSLCGASASPVSKWQSGKIDVYCDILLERNSFAVFLPLLVLSMIPINRQMCRLKFLEFALLAFSPRLHRRIRSFYDLFGPKAAKICQRNVWFSDATYVLLKPIEFVALILSMFAGISRVDMDGVYGTLVAFEKK